jgi:HTH-type transcriptional regulator/antitoxin HigA
MPDRASEADTEFQSPADALRGWMEQRGWSQTDLAYVLGVNSATVNQIISGKRGISAEMAKALAAAFALPLDTFARLQARWELQTARDPDPSVTARARVQAAYPLREMMKRGWIGGEGREIGDDLCEFFEVKSLDAVPHLDHAAKRTVVDEIPAPQLAWLFRVRQIARELPTPPYSREKLVEAVSRMAEMREAPEEARHVPRLLQEAGVRFVIVEGLPGGKIDGFASTASTISGSCCATNAPTSCTATVRVRLLSTLILEIGGLMSAMKRRSLTLRQPSSASRRKRSGRSI